MRASEQRVKSQPQALYCLCAGSTHVRPSQDYDRLFIRTKEMIDWLGRRFFIFQFSFDFPISQLVIEFFFERASCKSAR